MLTLDQAIGEQLRAGETPDPRQIADKIVADAEVAIDADFIKWAVAERVAMLQRSARAHRSFDGEDEEAAEPGPSKWSQMREVAPFINKFVDDLTVEDLEEIVDEYDKQIARGMKSRARYELMLSALKSSGCATVGEMRARESVPA